MADALDPSEQLKKALQWLESHRKRLRTEERMLTSKLEKTTSELQRLEGEITTAKDRLRELVGDDEQRDRASAS